MAKVYAAVQWVQMTLLGALMFVLTFLYTFNVGVREFLPALAPNFAWIDEISLFGLVWMVFLSLSLALEAGRHIGMPILLNRLPPTIQKVVKLIINLLGLGFSLYLVKVGVEITDFVANSGQRSPVLEVSVAWLYFVMPVGFALLAIQYLLELVTSADRYSKEIDPTHHI
jgi:C4-dicarboxylate transporter DctQ subunit